jgi:hypothetical protein
MHKRLQETLINLPWQLKIQAVIKDSLSLVHAELQSLAEKRKKKRNDSICSTD